MAKAAEDLSLYTEAKVEINCVWRQESPKPGNEKIIFIYKFFFTTTFMRGANIVIELPIRKEQAIARTALGVSMYEASWVILIVASSGMFR